MRKILMLFVLLCVPASATEIESLASYCDGLCTQENDPHRCRAGDTGAASGPNRCEALTRLCRHVKAAGRSPDSVKYHCERLEKTKD